MLFSATDEHYEETDVYILFRERAAWSMQTTLLLYGCLSSSLNAKVVGTTSSEHFSSAYSM